jgi:pimeloyl-ACP methyl ester carboxylesterase
MSRQHGPRAATWNARSSWKLCALTIGASLCAWVIVARAAKNPEPAPLPPMLSQALMTQAATAASTAKTGQSLAASPVPRMLSQALSAQAATATSSAPGAQPLAVPPIDPPMRAPWSRGGTKFLRQWLVAGPVPGALDQDVLTNSGDESALTPKANEVLATSAGERRWRPQISWANDFSMSTALVSPPYRGKDAQPEVAYAYGVIQREKEGPAELSIGIDGRFRLWVNGTEVHVTPTLRPFAFDAMRVPVTLKRGDNTVLLKTEHLSGPWSLAMRTLEPNAVIAKLSELNPVWSSPTPNTLTVQTDIRRDPKAAPVHVSVIAAGGKVLAQSDTARGDVAKFDTASWADGAYDIQLVTQNQAGERITMYLDWYKGDALAAAKRRVDAIQQQGAKADPTERMLAEMILDRLGGDFAKAPDDAGPLIHSPLMELEELAQIKTQGTGPIRPSGFVRLSYTDEADGSTQFCPVYLPAGYDPKQRWPAVVYLHGFNPPNPTYVRWWRVDQRHEPIAERFNVIYIEPHGRGNSQYLGIGEQDVLRCLELAKQRLSVDEDRVYLTGESMGGSGTWIISSRHPDLFAAAAPVFGGWDYRLIPNFGFDNPQAVRPGERATQESQSSFVNAENLLNVPLFVSHGDTDQTVNVEFSRHAVRMLQRWGYDIRYEEFPGGMHEDLNNRERNMAWMLQHKREAAPRKVRVRSMDLGGARAHWVQVQMWEQPLRPVRVEAEIIEPGVVRLDTDNVSSLTLTPPPKLRGTGNTLRVVWNGKEHTTPVSKDGVVLLSTETNRTHSLVKRPGFEGGLSRFFTTPFIVVVGTASSDPEMRRLCEENAQAFAGAWNVWQHTLPHVMKDTEITADLEKKYSLLLIGGADANLVTRRMAARLPLQTKKDSITVDGRRFAATDAVVQLLYPNPSQANRYVMVVAATSPAGMYFWNPAAFHHIVFGFPMLPMDWTIRDGRRVTLDNGLSPERAWIASGTFDAHWRRDDRWVFTGDETLRAQSPVRQAPVGASRGARTSDWDDYTGIYQFPFGVATVARDERGLTMETAGGPKLSLISERDGEFGAREFGSLLVFKRDTAGKVTSLTFHSEGQELLGTRIQ